MRAHQVDTSWKALQQCSQGIRVALAMIPVPDDEVFAKKTPFGSAFGMSNGIENRGKRPGSLDGHALRAFARKRVVQAEREREGITLQKSLEAGQDTGRGHADASWGKPGAAWVEQDIQRLE